MRKLRSRLTFANVCSFLALMIAIGTGSAYAANTVFSTDIVNGEVKTADIGTGEVGTADIANGGVATIDVADDAITQNKIIAGGVRTSEIANNQVMSVDVSDNALTTADLGAGSVASDEIADQTVTGADLAGTGFGDNGFNADEEILDGTIAGFDIGNDQIGANHIADGSLSAGDTSEVFDAGYASDGACNDDDQDGEACAAMTLELHQPGVLLVNATGEWANSGSGGDGVEMNCVLRVDGLDIGLAQQIGEEGDNHVAPQDGTMALTALSPQLEAGSHTVLTFCTEVNADIDLGDNQITAARVDL